MFLRLGDDRKLGRRRSELTPVQILRRRPARHARNCNSKSGSKLMPVHDCTFERPFRPDPPCKAGQGTLISIYMYIYIYILALTPSNNWMGFVDPGVMWILSACCGHMEGPSAALRLLHRRTDCHIRLIDVWRGVTERRIEYSID